MSSSPPAAAPLVFAAFAGIDWADRQHAWALQPDGSRQVEQGVLANTPEAVERWATALAQRFPGQLIALGLEQQRGALVAMLSKYAHLVLFPIPPNAAANYRKAFFPVGSQRRSGRRRSVVGDAGQTPRPVPPAPPRHRPDPDPAIPHRRPPQAGRSVDGHWSSTDRLFEPKNSGWEV